MPDTLGVTADEGALTTGLIAGFAERQAQLFEDEPPSIRTLDHAAEEANAEAYRDLLHEIERAFQGFDRSAVRHGWFADRGLNADAAQMEAANAARRCSNAMLGHVDLADFVIVRDCGGNRRHIRTGRRAAASRRLDHGTGRSARL